MERLLQKSKYSIFHNIFKYMIFQRRQKALLWSKGLILNNCHLLSHLFKQFGRIFCKQYGTGSDSLIRVHNVCYHKNSSLEPICTYTADALSRRDFLRITILAG